jgi:hypothetical protein
MRSGRRIRKIFLSDGVASGAEKSGGFLFGDN